MNNYLQKLASGSRDVHLSSSARMRIRAGLVARVALDRREAERRDAERRAALREAQDRRGIERRSNIPSPYYIVPRPFFVGALALLLVVSGATASAARGALPGDTLYQLKVSVLEPLRGAFAFNAIAKAEWHIALAEERLREAERLAVGEDLSEGRQAELTRRFLRAVTDARAALELAKGEDNERAELVAADLDLALTAHATILNKLGNGKLKAADEALKKAEESLAQGDYAAANSFSLEARTASGEAHLILEVARSARTSVPEDRASEIRKPAIEEEVSEKIETLNKHLGL